MQITKSIKNLIPNSVKAPYRQWKEIRALQQWTDEDAGRLLFYQDFVREGDLVFDVGANLGNRTKVFKKLGATVVAVEPQPRCSRILELAYKSHKSVRVVPKAVGGEAGQITMYLSEAHYLSSMSQDWMSKVSASGRFGSAKWDRKIEVPVTTLDTLIQTYGEPSFIKIDVEGHEQEVLKGLSHGVKALSFEFTPETLSAAISCVIHLEDIGMHQFNFVEGESTELSFSKWKSHSEIISLLETYRSNTVLFGDVYARR
jgi:FkbM family methyltransferase